LGERTYTGRIIPMSDQEIIELIRMGQHDKAFVRLYRHFPAVQKMIRALGGDKEDAKDIYQEALIIFCRKVKEDNFILTAATGTYLYSVCRFLWKNEQRKRGRHPETRLNIYHDKEDEEDMQDVLEKENNLKKIESTLKNLEERCRNLLKLFYYEKLNMKTIAEKMGFSSEKIAKNQKYKCLEKVRDELRTAPKKSVQQNTSI
jgi:RNA polymerase sigma factor (sigma-70 family)